MSNPPTMNDRDVWLKAAEIVAGFGDDGVGAFGGRLVEMLGEETSPEDWRRVAAAVDAIVSASRQ
ncbi:hypothetical protein [Sphingomonas sp. R86520]|uniref:hypothetical protein n=1 Tax=Sphingomonas sp. R86520 TaxID=3093859 RepID=UPI0036D2F7E0